MKKWDGARKGPCTLGEAKTMTAIITGCEPTEVEAFISIAVLKCESCGLPHTVVTNQNLAPEFSIQILTVAISKMVEELQ